MKQRANFRIDPALGRAAGVPLPPLVPYQRCTCGSCRECQTNAKWDRVFAKFEVKEEPDHWATKGMFQSTLRGW